MRHILLSLLASASALGQEPSTVPPDASVAIVYVCPEDEGARSPVPANCPKSGTAMIPTIPEPVEYLLDLEVESQPIQVGQSTRIAFKVLDPWNLRPVTSYYVVHEKILHAFLVSDDLEVFLHQHPVLRGDGLDLDVVFPQSGMYRVLADFYPVAATPQLLVGTIFVPGSTAEPLAIGRDYSPKTAENVTVEFSTTPEQPSVGAPTQLVFQLSPGDGLEQYLGAWAHAFVASDDLIDLMHAHPFLADGTTTIRFGFVFPRARSYRIWAQFQRNGVVNTAHFDIAVSSSPEAD